MHHQYSHHIKTRAALKLALSLHSFAFIEIAKFIEIEPLPFIAMPFKLNYTPASGHE